MLVVLGKGHYFVTWGFFSKAFFLQLVLYFVTLFKKYFEYGNNLFHNYFLVPKLIYHITYTYFFFFSYISAVSGAFYKFWLNID
jgi:hypothetical protein